MYDLYTLPETNSSHLKNGCLVQFDCFLLGPGLFSGANLLLVSGSVILRPNIRAIEPRSQQIRHSPPKAHPNSAPDGHWSLPTNCSHFLSEEFFTCFCLHNFGKVPHQAPTWSALRIKRLSIFEDFFCVAVFFGFVDMLNGQSTNLQLIHTLDVSSTATPPTCTSWSLPTDVRETTVY